MTHNQKVNKVLRNLELKIYDSIEEIEKIGFSTDSAVDIVRDYLKEKF